MTDKPEAAEAPRAPQRNRTARRRARELALQGLYEWLVGGQDVAAIEGHIMEHEAFDKSDVAHFREVLHGVIEHADILRGEFAGFIDRKLSELSPVEHGCLLIGAYEMKFRQEIPYRVVINEAVELAKSYGGTEGYKYVNGVLDKVAVVMRSREISR
jgi:transcription antitermination protein NusB